MKHLLPVLLLLLGACASSPVDVNLSYLNGDRQTYEVVAPAMTSFLDHAAGSPVLDRAQNPWTQESFSDDEIESLRLLLVSWRLRLEAAEAK